MPIRQSIDHSQSDPVLLMIVMNALLAFQIRHYDALRVQWLIVCGSRLLLLFMLAGHRRGSQRRTRTVLPLFLQLGHFLSPLFFFIDLPYRLSHLHGLGGVVLRQQLQVIQRADSFKA